MYIDTTELVDGKAPIVSLSYLFNKYGIVPVPKDKMGTGVLSYMNAIEVVDGSGDVPTGYALADGTREYRAFNSEELAVEAKAEAAKQISEITVTVNGKVFDGDEDSQTRIARAVALSSPGETTQWRLNDNSWALVTHEELAQAGRLAGDAQVVIMHTLLG